MTNEELIDILNNIPKEVLQSKNHEELHSVVNSESPRLNLCLSTGNTALELILYETVQYRIWYNHTLRDLANQIKSYLNILGFTEVPLYSTTSRYTPHLGVAINSTMADAEMMKLIQLELQKQ